MKTLFNLGSGNEARQEHSLLFEIGKDYCCYALWDNGAQAIDSLQFISFNETEQKESLAQIIAGIPKQDYSSVWVCSALPEALLVPWKYFRDSYEMLDAVYDQPAQAYKHDKIPEWQMVTIYSLPAAVHQLLQSSFDSIEYIHAYTPLVKLHSGYDSDDQLSVHFTPQYFRVLLKKNAAVQLAQTYFYSSPLDVVYYLLKISYEFELNQSSVYLILSGLIEKDSSLYTELNQYFANVHFAPAPEMRLPDNDLPHYFFTSLYNLATCVSSVEV